VVTNGNSAGGDLEAMKQEILREMRKEITKAKQEIIDGEISNTQTIVAFDLLTFLFQ
jgi:vacuolar-type H+-ATPase subunit H